MSRAELDPERGRAVAAELRAHGVRGVLVQAAEQGYITEFKCGMPECFCPEEVGGAGYFDPLPAYSHWNPTHEHFPRPKRSGGHRLVGNAVLAHRICNRIGYHIEAELSYAKDLATIEKARGDAIRRKSEGCASDESDCQGASGP